MTSLAIAAAEPGYDRVARGLHWLVAALVVIVVSLGWAIGGAPRNTWTRELLLLLHRSVGLTILAAMVLRALWRWRNPPPALPPRVAALERFLAGCTHAALYVLFVIMPLAGYVNAAAAGHAVSFFGIISIPPLLPENSRVSQAAIAVHLVGQYLVYLFVLLHIAGGLMHGVVRQDGVLERMLPIRRTRTARSAG